MTLPAGVTVTRARGAVHPPPGNGSTAAAHSTQCSSSCAISHARLASTSPPRPASASSARRVLAAFASPAVDSQVPRALAGKRRRRATSPGVSPSPAASSFESAVTRATSSASPAAAHDAS